MRTIQPVDESPPPTTRLAGKGALPTIWLATILGLLATAALLGVVSATAGLGVAGWIAGLATGSAATALLVTARMRSDQPAIFLGRNRRFDHYPAAADFFGCGYVAPTIS